jgi:hypothetical protein
MLSCQTKCNVFPQGNTFNNQISKWKKSDSQICAKERKSKMSVSEENKMEKEISNTFASKRRFELNTIII